MRMSPYNANELEPWNVPLKTTSQEEDRVALLVPNRVQEIQEWIGEGDLFNTARPEFGLFEMSSNFHMSDLMMRYGSNLTLIETIGSVFGLTDKDGRITSLMIKSWGYIDGIDHNSGETRPLFDSLIWQCLHEISGRKKKLKVTQGEYDLLREVFHRHEQLMSRLNGGNVFTGISEDYYFKAFVVKD